MTLDQFAEALGVTSRGHMSVVERSGKCSLALALAIERLSEGEVDAAALNDDVAAARRAA